MILSSELEPGARLVVRVLSERFGLSPTPIKEALVALEGEGLVVSKARKGYSVAKLDFADIRRLYDLREVVEGLAARLAAHSATPALIDTLEAVHAKHQKRLLAGDLEGSGETDLEFHRALWRASDNSHLEQVAATFPARMRLAMASIRTAVPRRNEQAIEEHGKILDHIRNAEPAGAEAAMRRHIQLAVKAMQPSRPVSDE